MNPIYRRLASRRARQYAERIAEDFGGTPVETIQDVPNWGDDKVVYTTVLPDGAHVEVSWSTLMPLGLFSTLGAVYADGADFDDEDAVRTFWPGEYDGVMRLRWAYHRATGSDLPR